MLIKDDFRDWIIDNFTTEIKENIIKSIDKYSKELPSNGKTFDISNMVDRNDLVDEILDSLKTGLLNVIDTYDCSEINEEVIRKINIIDDYVDEEIYQQVKYVNYLDLKEYISDIREITTEVE